MSLLERLQNRIHGEATWPPPEQREHWEKVQDYRRRFVNDHAEMLQYSPHHNRSSHRAQIYTPVAFAREVARLSAALLFSDAPDITFEKNEDLWARVRDANGLPPFLQAAAESIAIEGRGALRVIIDEDIAEEPLITHVHEDRVIWQEKHGRFVTGGAVVIERKPKPRSTEVFRLIEEHEKGVVRRALYRGTNINIGTQVALDDLPEFEDLDEEEDTGLDVPTLLRWDNVPGGYSDLAGQDVMLDRLDEAVTGGVDKERKSRPVSFADASLFDDQGRADLGGIIPIRRGNDRPAPPLGEEPKKMAETIQPEFRSEEQANWFWFLWDVAAATSGISPASLRPEASGQANSGTALKLMQQRTLLTRSGKERMAKEAIINAVAVALCWADGGSDTSKYRPKVTLGTGLPTDELEQAQRLTQLRGAEALSREQAIRELYPAWTDEQVEEEVTRQQAEFAGPQPRVPELNEDMLFGGLEDGRG